MQKDLIWISFIQVLTKKEKEREIGAKYVDLDTLLEHSDFITINAAYNPDIHHMIDSEQFKNEIYCLFSQCRAWTNR